MSCWWCVNVDALEEQQLLSLGGCGLFGSRYTAQMSRASLSTTVKAPIKFRLLLWSRQARGIHANQENFGRPIPLPSTNIRFRAILSKTRQETRHAYVALERSCIVWPGTGVCQLACRCPKTGWHAGADNPAGASKPCPVYFNLGADRSGYGQGV